MHYYIHLRHLQFNFITFTESTNYSNPATSPEMLSTIGKGEENDLKHLARATGCQGGLHPSAALLPKSFSVVVLVLLLLNCNSLPTPRLKIFSRVRVMVLVTSKPKTYTCHEASFHHWVKFRQHHEIHRFNYLPPSCFFPSSSTPLHPASTTARSFT